MAIILDKCFLFNITEIAASAPPAPNRRPDAFSNRQAQDCKDGALTYLFAFDTLGAFDMLGGFDMLMEQKHLSPFKNTYYSRKRLPIR